jgi:hypothetical protein
VASRDAALSRPKLKKSRRKALRAADARIAEFVRERAAARAAQTKALEEHIVKLAREALEVHAQLEAALARPTMTLALPAQAPLAAPATSVSVALESASRSGVISMSFAWQRRPPQQRLRPRVAYPEAPGPDRLNDGEWMAAFGGTDVCAREQQILRVSVESVESTAPYPLVFSLCGVDNRAGRTLMRLPAYDGTLGVPPGITSIGSLELFRARRVAPYIIDFTVASVSADNEHYIVPASSKLGEFITVNLERLQAEPAIEFMRGRSLYIITKKLFTDIQCMYRESMPDITSIVQLRDIEGRLRRGDLTGSMVNAEFASTDELRGMSRLEREFADARPHEVRIDLRVDILDCARA